MIVFTQELITLQNTAFDFFFQPVNTSLLLFAFMNTAPTSVHELDDMISTPNERVIELVRGLEGRFAVLGAGGKMGFHICRMLQRALVATGREDNVLAVSRFGDLTRRKQFEAAGVNVIAADLAETEQVASLPDAANIISLAAIKFGTTGRPGLLTRINQETSQRVTERYRDSRIVMLSTGCVYPFVTPESGGSTEDSSAEAPGEYAQSRLAQETIFAEASIRNNTPTVLLRLNYSIELRYGVLLDLAQKVFRRQPVDVTMGYVNVIWQGDAVSHIIQALTLADSPAIPFNVTGPEIIRVRDLANLFADRFGRPVNIVGTEERTAWLNNASRSHRRFGAPQISLSEMIEWVATWVEQGGETYNKPTHFESRGDGY